MIAFVCYFFPAVLGIWLFEVISKKELTKKQYVFRFCGYTLALNFVCFAVKKFILKTAENSLVYGNDMKPSTAFNYLVIVIPVVLILVIGELLLSKKVKIAVEETVDETKEEN